MTPTLHVLCGKLASGKTTLARRIEQESGAVLVSEDFWLARLFPGEIATFEDYLARSRRFRSALGPHIAAVLRRGTSVVLDFAGNVPAERAWARGLSEAAAAAFLLHYIDASDDVCKQRLRQRNAELPEGAQHTTEGEFDAITRYFVPPSATEGADIRVHHGAAATARLETS
ncbi:MAG TPA: ATP-binding protein [Vicinamibacterales bacterium]|nr:ATP-binding protein [Vicinamibacterales bacterium]